MSRLRGRLCRAPSAACSSLGMNSARRCTCRIAATGRCGVIEAPQVLLRAWRGRTRAVAIETAEAEVFEIAEAGFDVETNVVTFFRRNGGETALPRMSKFDVANRVLDEVLRLRRGAP